MSIPLSALRLKYFFMFGIGLAFLSLLKLSSHRYILNVSPSMPRGVYRMVKTQQFKRNDIVAFCLENPARQLGRDRKYILAGSQCFNSAPLVKKILAVPGDNVVLTNASVSVNGKAYPYKTLTQDRQGRRLPAIALGNYFHTPGVWLIGTHDLRSWDARYWGAVNPRQLRYALIPVLTEK